jgi:heme o synthase
MTRHPFIKHLHDLFLLTRIKVSLSVALLCAASYSMAIQKFTLEAWKVSLAILFLSSGASALNQCQERKQDAKMERTKNRPLASKRMRLHQGIIISFSLLICGLCIEAILTNSLCLTTSLFNIVWYNGVYTYCKRATPYAVIPGALTGAIPVFTGFTAAGTVLFYPLAVFTAFFVFVWQVPHFWSLLFKYSKEYEKAGFPIIKNQNKEFYLNRLIFLWFTALVVSSFTFVWFRIIPSSFSSISLEIIGLLLTSIMGIRIHRKEEAHTIGSTMIINIYMILFLTLLMIERLS